MAKIKTGILGATAYTGIELVKILTRHPSAEISFISSRSYAGQNYCSVFPQMKGIFDAGLIPPKEALSRDVDCVFSCLPHAVSAGLCLPFINKGIKTIDLSADFRLSNPDNYKTWYKIDHPCPEHLKTAVFGLPEHYRSSIAKASIIANPGCYPTSVLLPLLPLVKNRIFNFSSIIADSKSGISGAGRSLKMISLFPEAHENLSAYSVGRAHRHISEIDQELSSASGKKINITFSPHLVPMNRGIMSTIYIFTDQTAETCLETVEEYYKKEPFVRIRSKGDLPSVGFVTGTNYCDISFAGGNDGQPVIAVSVIDNLLKGASGQAVQNMNIMFGIDETLGLL